MAHGNTYPKLHNAAWPGLVGKGPDSEPPIDLDTMLQLTADASVDGVKFDGIDLFLFDPHVSIDVLTFRPFYILGEVTSPGQYPYSAKLTVMNAVATAKGFTYRADKRRVYIKHPGGAEQAVPLTAGVLVAPGDTIRIGERYF